MRFSRKKLDFFLAPSPSILQYSPMNERVGATGRSPEQPNCERSEVRG